MGAMKKEGTLSNLVPEELSQLGKVLHHSAAFNPRRNEYLVAFDFDVDKDNVPDQLYAGRVDSSGQVVPDRVLNFTSDINGTAGMSGKLFETDQYGHFQWRATLNPCNTCNILSPFRVSRHWAVTISR